MTPGVAQFQLFVLSPIADAAGNENWTLYAGAATMEELEAVVRDHKIQAWAIMALFCVKVGQPAAGAPGLMLVGQAANQRPA